MMTLILLGLNGSGLTTFFLLFAVNNTEITLGREIMAILASLSAILFAAPYWTMKQVLLIHLSTDKNRGHEVSLSFVVDTIGAGSGALAGGVALTFLSGFAAPGVTLCVLWVGSLLMWSLLSSLDVFRQPETRPFWIPFDKVIMSSPNKTFNTLMEGAATTTNIFLVPVWLSALSIAGLTVGLLYALQMMLQLLISPFAGNLTNKGRANESVAGGALYALGWFPWLFIIHPAVYIFSSMVWVLGSHLYQVGLGSRWISTGLYSGIAAREFLLNISRIFTTLLVLPLIYYQIEYFFVVAILIMSFVIFFSYEERRELSKAAEK